MKAKSRIADGSQQELQLDKVTATPGADEWMSAAEVAKLLGESGQAIPKKAKSLNIYFEKWVGGRSKDAVCRYRATDVYAARDRKDADRAAKLPAPAQVEASRDAVAESDELVARRHLDGIARVQALLAKGELTVAQAVGAIRGELAT